jgi:hypothetical protein
MVYGQRRRRTTVLVALIGVVAMCTLALAAVSFQ